MKNIPKNRTVDITILYRNGGGEESNSFAVDNVRKHEEGIMEWQRVAEENAREITGNCQPEIPNIPTKTLAAYLVATT